MPHDTPDDDAVERGPAGSTRVAVERLEEAGHGHALWRFGVRSTLVAEGGPCKGFDLTFEPNAGPGDVVLRSRGLPIRVDRGNRALIATTGRRRAGARPGGLAIDWGDRGVVSRSRRTG